MYQWIVLLHIVGAFVFVLSHGVAVYMVNELPKQRDSRRIMALLDMSSASLTGVYVGLLLLLLGGVWAGIDGGHFSRLWIWAAIGVLVAIIVAMYLVATPYFKRLRLSLGRRVMGMPKDGPDPVPLGEAEILAIAAQAPAVVLTAIGVGGLLIILWLMVPSRSEASIRGTARRPSSGLGGAALERLEDRDPGAVMRHPDRLQHASRDAVAHADEAEEQMLGADPVVVELASLVDGQLDDPLGIRGQPDLTDDGLPAATDDELDCGPDLRQVDPHRGQDGSRDTVALAKETQEHVLGADVVVVEALRLVLGQRQDATRLIGEAIEPMSRVAAGIGWLARVDAPAAARVQQPGG